jgi:hypothetical protein
MLWNPPECRLYLICSIFYRTRNLGPGEGQVPRDVGSGKDKRGTAGNARAKGNQQNPDGFLLCKYLTTSSWSQCSGCTFWAGLSDPDPSVYSTLKKLICNQNRIEINSCKQCCRSASLWCGSGSGSCLSHWCGSKSYGTFQFVPAWSGSYHSLLPQILTLPCSKMTLQDFHLFTLIRIRILLFLWCGSGSGSSLPLWCGSGSSFSP